MYGEELLVKRNAKLLPRIILFQKATRLDTFSEKLKKKYKPINEYHSRYTKENENENKNNKGTLKPKQLENNSGKAQKKDNNGELLELPSVQLHDPNTLRKYYKWTFSKSVGSGLKNLGNSGFLNSVIQCLSYIPLFSQYLLSKEHSKNCKIRASGLHQSARFCSLCSLEEIVCDIHNNPTHTTYSMRTFIRSLRVVARSLRWGKKEDAHEFLIHLLNNAAQNLISDELK
ncbi:ubiquitin carboxyl-terminal hydrolase [Anaeramoeba flamelloides]|uniref:ubiquitinyl hydrolase 1 n=1 Tax=Anaeramoeba flamelloides TaxID=1746091 RepID=A0AAV7ZH85_9EUKA|nr:ubiquitin carboxyl-terminal hydrolase [Anaeramoeba flamelloides]